MAKKRTGKGTQRQQLTAQASDTPSVNQYAILDDIPLPVHKGRGAASRFPFDQMMPGQCIAVSMKDENVESIEKLRGRIRNAIYSHSKKGTGAKFVTDVTADGLGMYIWRKPEIMAA